jgi:hypothetical protein
MQVMPSPSIERTCPGKPGQASHVKRYKGFPTKVKHFPRRDASRSDGSRNAFDRRLDSTFTFTFSASPALPV